MQKDVPVVMCTYKRPERLSLTISQLESQVGIIPKLFIWNNNPEIKNIVDAEIFKPHNIHINAFHSETNIGGFGRFKMAQRLCDEYDRVIFIDDDVNLQKNSLKILNSEYEPKTSKSFYAFILNNSNEYLDRTRSQIGELSDYCGTGGMISDISIFNLDSLYECPKEFWFIEDLWLSYYAITKLKWKLYKSAAEFELLNDQHDQWIGSLDKKTEFLQYLVKSGWKLIGEKN